MPNASLPTQTQSNFHQRTTSNFLSYTENMKYMYILWKQSLSTHKTLNNHLHVHMHTQTSPSAATKTPTVITGLSVDLMCGR